MLARILLVGSALSLIVATASFAEEAGKVTGSSSFSTVNGTTYGFCAMHLLEVDGKPAACFGLIKPDGGPARYTYLILFKPSAKGGEGGTGVEGGGTSQFESTGHVVCDLKMKADVAGREIPVEYKLKTDPKKFAVLEERLSVGGKEYGKDDARVFLVDLADEKATCQPVKVIPTAVPDFANEDAWGKTILAAKKELVEKSPEAKAFFGK
jgi:hypothetical protein